MNNIIAILVAFLLLAANAFFVAAEFASTSSRREQIEALEGEQRWGVKDALYAVEHVSLMLAVCQLGITLASVGLGAVAEPAVANLLLHPLRYLGLPSLAIHTVAFFVSLFVVVVAHIIIGEMVPKNLSLGTPVKMLLILAPILTRIAVVVRPIVSAMNWGANRVVRLFGVEPRDHVGEAFTAEEMVRIVEKSAQAGKLSGEVELLSDALSFASVGIAEVMVPKEKVVCLQWPFTPEKYEEKVAKTGYSRFIITGETGSFIGYLHVKDLLYADNHNDRSRAVPRWRVRELLTINKAEDIEAALLLMQQHGVHLIAVQEGDEIVGVVFLEDILEELVGEVRDSLQRPQI